MPPAITSLEQVTRTTRCCSHYCLSVHPDFKNHYGSHSQIKVEKSFAKPNPKPGFVCASCEDSPKSGRPKLRRPIKRGTDRRGALTSCSTTAGTGLAPADPLHCMLTSPLFSSLAHPKPSCCALPSLLSASLLSSITS